MDEEDRKTALSQITNYDQLLSSYLPINTLNCQRHFTVVVVPPKAPNTKEKWVGVCAADGSFNTDFVQPDPERKVICGNNDNGCLCYWYADELPRCVVLAVVFTVILSIFTTPLVLLCCVPMIHGMNKARHDISNDDIPAARRHWRTACQWPYFGACIWVSIILSIVISGLIIGIVFAIVL